MNLIKKDLRVPITDEMVLAAQKRIHRLDMTTAEMKAVLGAALADFDLLSVLRHHGGEVTDATKLVPKHPKSKWVIKVEVPDSGRYLVVRLDEGSSDADS